MLRKVKIALWISIVSVIVLAVILILVSLDRLDFEHYGLNYNHITATFSDDLVYEPSIYLVGMTNQLLQIPKTYRQISFPNIQTYTNDYFPLTISAQISYKASPPTRTQNGTQDFDYLKNFYILFGSEENTKKILRPITRNQIVNAVSSRSSIQYQSAVNISTTLESQIQTSISTALSGWSDLSTIVLITSISCKGVSYNLEPLERKISYLVAQLQHAQAQKIEMTDYVNSVLAQTQTQMQNILAMIETKIASTILLMNTLGNSANILMVSEATAGNASFSSSQLGLRPQLYLINATQY